MRVHEGLDGPVDVIVAGDGAEAALEPALARLRELRDDLADQAAQGTTVLAVGLGWDVLADVVEVTPGDWRAGAGVFGGEAALLDEWASGELVGSSPWGPVAGYENHARGYRRTSDERAWGSVRLGTGNGDGSEGVELGGLLGTHLHGPVLATHPRIADAVLDRALRRRHGVAFAPSGAVVQRVDAMAARAREHLLRRTRLARWRRRFGV